MRRASRGGLHRLGLHRLDIQLGAQTRAVLLSLMDEGCELVEALMGWVTEGRSAELGRIQGAKDPG